MLAKSKMTLLHGSLLQYGNTLLLTNVPYALQHGVSQLLSSDLKITKDSESKAHKLKDNGFVKLNPIDVKDMSTLAKTYLSKQKSDSNGVITLDRDKAADFTLLLYKALSTQLESVLNAYYGSHFQLYWTNIMRYEKANASVASSFGYHLDDNPKELLKVFFYLNDTHEWNAAFRAFNYETTKDLIEQGFISSTSELRVASQKFITPQLVKKKLHIMEGKQGTVLIFDNNLVHKGTSPKRGYRDVVVVEVYPSNKRFTMDDVYRSLTVPYVTDYPPNPFYNDLMV